MLNEKNGEKENLIRDIIPPTGKAKASRAKVRVPIAKASAIADEQEVPLSTQEREITAPKILIKHAPEQHKKVLQPSKLLAASHHQKPHRIPETSASRFAGLFKRLVYLAIASVVIVGGGYLGLAVLPRANIHIILAKKEVALNESVAVDKNIAQASVQSASLPGELFKESSNVQLTFPASEKKNVEVKARGMITIYNAYSSSPQSLVAGTRFVTPDNKVFRIDKAVKVPGAQIVDGKIIPASVAAAVTADVAGPEYNVGPVKRFSIPGFKGSPKYEAFYGDSTEAMTGGFIGQVAVPSSDDLKNARAQVTKTLQDSLKQKIYGQWPEGLKVIDGAESFKITKEEVQQNIGEEGKFGLFAEAEMKVIAFKESDVHNLLYAKAKQQAEGEHEVVSSQFEYGIPRIDFTKGAMSFPVKATVLLRRKVDLEVLAKTLVDKDETGLKTAIFALPGLENARISLWPFWVRHAPGDLAKIAIDLE